MQADVLPAAGGSGWASGISRRHRAIVDPDAGTSPTASQRRATRPRHILLPTVGPRSTVLQERFLLLVSLLSDASAWCDMLAPRRATND